MAKLIVNPTSSSRREIPLPRTVTSIGRDPSNDVVLPDAMVSRRHAVIEYRGSQYFLRDCNSSNGSLINGDRVGERHLRDGDLLAIGTARLVFREERENEDAVGKVVPHPSAPRLVCPACQADFRKGDLYCRQCGTSLAQAGAPKATCTDCGTVVPLPARFCNACGARLPQPESRSAEGRPSEVRLEKTVEAPPPDPEPQGEPQTGAEGRPPAGTEAPSGPAAVERKDAAPCGERSGMASAAPAPRVAAIKLASSGPARDVVPSAGPRRHETTRPTRVLSAAPALWPLPAPEHAPRKAEPDPDDTRGSSSPPAPGGSGRRLLAALVDGAAVTGAAAVVLSPSLAYWGLREGTAEPSFVAVLLSLSLVPVALATAALYYIHSWGRRGATPGQRLLGLALETESGQEPIGMARAAVRLLGYLLSAALLGVGFLMVPVTGSGLHDHIAGTRVVRRRT